MGDKSEDKSDTGKYVGAGLGAAGLAGAGGAAAGYATSHHGDKDDVTQEKGLDSKALGSKDKETDAAKQGLKSYNHPDSKIQGNQLTLGEFESKDLDDDDQGVIDSIKGKTADY